MSEPDRGMTTIENRRLSLSVDALGRLISLKNKSTGTELITYPEAAEAWRMVLPTGRHTRDFVWGSQQTPAGIAVVHKRASQSIVITYDAIKTGHGVIPLAATFTLTLESAGQIAASVELDNKSQDTIEEVEFPVIGGLGGFEERGKRSLNMVVASDNGTFYTDVLHWGFPHTGRESDQFVRYNETAMFEPATVEGGGWAGARKRGWLDLWSARQGLYVAYLADDARDFGWKVEHYPKGVPNPPAHYYPAGTPRWLRLWGIHVPQLAPGQKWVSPPVIVMPHRGDWHAGADHYSAYRHAEVKAAATPAWMNDFCGWTEIIGKTYLGEVFHDYAHCAEEIVKDKKVTGLDMVFYYGHSRIGAEGADFDHSPAPDLGGEVEFRKMVDKLHANGIRIILLDHFHRWVNQDVPQYKELGLERYALLDKEGKLRTDRWWKETFLSCRKLAGPTPVWVEMCPACPEWHEYYRKHIESMIKLGVDGVEMDTFGGSPYCFNPAHKHPLGAYIVDAKLDFIRAVREHAKRLNPDFIMIAESMSPAVRGVTDGFYSGRYPNEHGRIFRYLFPENRQQTVRTGNYDYEAVNRALSLGLSPNTEIWGLRTTALAGCPEFAPYIGEVNRFKRKYGDILIRGTFRDTVGAQVTGDVYYSVLEGQNGQKALVLRNYHDQATKARGALLGTGKGQHFVLWRPFAKEETVEKPSVQLQLGPFEVAVLLAL